MSTLIVTAMIATFILLVASVVLYRLATAPPEGPHGPDNCRHCAELFSSPASIPGRRTGGES